jgi:hypothetical protein
MMARLVVGTVAALMLVACGGSSKDTEAGAARPPKLQQLRIGILAPAASPCRSDAPEWPAAQRKYVQHLASRMEVPVSLCPMAEYSAIAAAIADGRIEMGPVDRAGLAPVAEKIRPILAVRPDTAPGRAIAAVVVREAAPARTLADLAPAAGRVGARLILSRENSDILDGVRRILTSAGFPAASLAAASAQPDAETAAAALRSGAGDAAAVGGAEWYRYCRGTKKDETPCAGLREVWRGREPVAVAWSVSRNIAPESWAQLVGIHIALFLEQPAIAAWLAPGGREITPVEATALEPAGQ